MQPSQDGDAPVIRDFLKWFNDQDGTTISPKIQLKDIQDAGRGLVATTDIEEGEDLFRIPRHLILDSQTSNLRQNLGDKLDGLDPWMSLILTLIYEKLQGDNSKWAPYIRLLPAKFDTLMFWSKEDLSELQASAVVGKIGKKNAESAFTSELLPIIRSHPDLFPLTQKKTQDEVIRRAHLAGSCVMAYAFDIEKDDQANDDSSFVTDDEDDPAKGMVPFADMLNADAEKNNAHLAQEDNYFTMKSTRPIVAGDEIFNTYGELPRSDLLRRYGYVADSYTQYDIAEVSLELIEDLAKSQGLTRKIIQKALAPVDEVGALDDGYALQRSDSHNIKDLIPTELLMVIKALCKEARAQEPGDPEEARIDGLYVSEISFLHIVLVNRIGEYATSLEEDSKFLESLTTDQGSATDSHTKQRRLKMALQVRIGEKEILHHARTVAEQWIKTRNAEFAEQGAKRKANDEPNGASGRPGKAAKSS